MTPTNTDATTGSERTAVSSVSEQNTDRDETLPLLDLPPEIWSRICKLAVIHNENVQLEENESPKHYQDRVYQPSITRVCTVIRNETISSFYSLNTFVIVDNGGSMHGLLAWIAAIGSARARKLKQLYVDSRFRDSLQLHIAALREDYKLKLNLGDSEFRSMPDDSNWTEEMRRYRLAYASPE